MKYFVEYNSRFIAMYKSIRACVNFITRKGLKNGYTNALRIYDENGDEYTENGDLVLQ